MKKVVRITESDLTNLVKRIIKESPFDYDSFEKIPTDTEMSDDEIGSKVGEFKNARKEYDEFEKSDVFKLLFDMEMLLVIAKDYCQNYAYDDRNDPHQYCSGIKYIEERMNKFHSDKYSKRTPYQSQPIYPKK